MKTIMWQINKHFLFTMLLGLFIGPNTNDTCGSILTFVNEFLQPQKFQSVALVQ